MVRENHTYVIRSALTATLHRAEWAPWWTVSGRKAWAAFGLDIVRARRTIGRPVQRTLALLGAIACVIAAFGTGAAAQVQPSEDDECRHYTQHSGHLPDQYDYGIFIEHDPAVRIVSTTSEDPAAHGAGNRWDEVLAR